MPPLRPAFALLAAILPLASQAAPSLTPAQLTALSLRGRDLAMRVKLEDACRAFLARSAPSAREWASPIISLGPDRWTATFLQVDALGSPKVLRTLTCAPGQLEALTPLDRPDIPIAEKSQVLLVARALRQLGSASATAYLVSVPEPGGGATLYRMSRRNTAGAVVLGQDFILTHRPSTPLPFKLTPLHRALWTLSDEGMPGTPAGAKAVGLMHSHLDLADPSEVDVAAAILSGAVDVFVMVKDGLYKCSSDGTITRTERQAGGPNQGRGGPAEGEDLPGFRAFAFDRKAFDHENRWVVLPGSGKGSYLFACVYLDEQAGFTSHLGGAFRLDPEGRAILDPTFDTSKASFKIRLQKDFFAAPLPEGIAKDLGLEGRPAFRAAYVPDQATAEHLLRRGFHLNHIGECERAVQVLEPLFRSQPTLKGLAFELAFAYNALNQAGKAVPVLEDGVKRNPEDPWLARELAYSYLHSGRYREAVGAYGRSIPLIASDNLQERSEQAMNLAMAHQQLGELGERDAWFAKAKAWAPPGSPVAQYFAKQPQAKP